MKTKKENANDSGLDFEAQLWAVVFKDCDFSQLPARFASRFRSRQWQHVVQPFRAKPFRLHFLDENV